MRVGSKFIYVWYKNSSRTIMEVWSPEYTFIFLNHGTCELFQWRMLRQNCLLCGRHLLLIIKANYHMNGLIRVFCSLHETDSSQQDMTQWGTFLQKWLFHLKLLLEGHLVVEWGRPEARRSDEEINVPQRQSHLLETHHYSDIQSLASSALCCQPNMCPSSSHSACVNGVIPIQLG